MNRIQQTTEALRDFYDDRFGDDNKYADIQGECWKLLDNAPEAHDILDATGNPIPGQYWAPSEEGGSRYPNLFFTLYFLFNNRTFEYIYRTPKGEIYMNYIDGEGLEDDVDDISIVGNRDELLMPDEQLIFGQDIYKIRNSGAKYLLISCSCLQTKSQYRRHLR